MNAKLKILLADDSRFFRAIEGKFLQKTPVDILETDHCAEALSIIRNDRPDLVYMAFSLPSQGGASCCQKIKEDPSLRTIPVVLICDQGKAEQAVIAKQSDCDAVLTKPLDRHTFLQVGRQFLAGIREHRQPSFFPLTFTSGGDEFSGKCLDISGGGMFIESQAAIEEGTLINLKFKLPTAETTQISCSGEVMWQNRKPNPMKPHYPHGLGVKFVGLSEIVHKAILRLSDKQKEKY
ncbi:MAG: response regulator [Gammaproteobacteria bacterium]|nr:response regulator [Gammaproteobacteria bacterium]NIR92609.1 response regulator [Gammaproteobacteria bacterium]NIW48291.1 response regulator [Gammaproteobacteria bacterium]